MKNSLYVFFLCIGTSITSCKMEAADPQVLIDVDLAFSEMSSNEGITKAFIHYADSSVVLLRNGTDPILGYAELVESYSKRSNTTTTLTWVPEKAEIAASGDLGFTWGKYRLTLLDTLGNSMPQMGYYVSIWKKHSNGDWKYVLDGGTVPVPMNN